MAGTPSRAQKMVEDDRAEGRGADAAEGKFTNFYNKIARPRR
jgi:hypothetical protein